MQTLRIATMLIALALSCVITPGIWAQDSSGSGSDHISVLPSELKWAPALSVGPGAEIAVIEGDLKAAAPFTFRLKLPPNFKVGVHTHPVKERVTVISGTFYLGIGDTFDRAKAKAYPAGGLAMLPPGMPMFAYTTQKETIIQVHGTGPWGIEFLNPEDNPAKK